MILEITEQEAQALGNIIDEAVKAKGVQVAAAGLFFIQKIQDAIKKESNVIPINQDASNG